MREKGQIDIRLIGFVAAVVIVSLFFARGISTSSPQVALTIALGIGVCIITFLKPQAGLYILIFSMLLSPEFKVIEVPKRSVVVRVEDILLIVIFVTWIVRLAVNKELSVLRFTPLNKLLLSYALISALITGFAIVQGRVNPLKSFFYLLKYIEYFFLYFMVSNSLHSKKQAKNLVKYMIITAVIVCIYSYFRIATGRVASTPFEGEAGEPATLGGYLLVIISVLMGLAAYAKSRRTTVLMILIIFFAIPPLFYSGSRASLLGFIPMYVTFLIFTKHKKALFAGIMVCVVALMLSGVLSLPGTTKEKFKRTFSGEEISFGPARLHLGSSAMARVESWQESVKLWTKSPLWGYGVTGIGFFLDGQYFLVLGETGLIGMFLFLWILFKLSTNTLQTFYSSKDEYVQGLSLGFLAGLIGLMTHALTSNTFIIVRIMEPFWFLAAIIMTLPGLEQSAEEDRAEIEKGKIL